MPGEKKCNYIQFTGPPSDVPKNLIICDSSPAPLHLSSTLIIIDLVLLSVDLEISLTLHLDSSFTRLTTGNRVPDTCLPVIGTSQAGGEGAYHAELSLVQTHLLAGWPN